MCPSVNAEVEWYFVYFCPFLRLHPSYCLTAHLECNAIVPQNYSSRLKPVPPPSLFTRFTL